MEHSTVRPHIGLQRITGRESTSISVSGGRWYKFSLTNTVAMTMRPDAWSKVAYVLA
jgi:hypothetical protein